MKNSLLQVDTRTKCPVNPKNDPTKKQGPGFFAWTAMLVFSSVLAINNGFGKPVITLKGSNPVTIAVHTNYMEAGATASEAGYTTSELMALMTINSNVDTTHTGTYTVTYELTDPGGLKADPAVRTIYVVDTTAPQISINGIMVDSMAVSGKYNDLGVTANDNYDKTGITIVVSGTFYSKFPLGIAVVTGVYTIVYTATDQAGNKASVTRIIKVKDYTAPIVALKGNVAIALCQFVNYVDDGYSITDNYDSIKFIKLDTISTFYTNGGTSTPGLYTLQFEATDKSGNSGYSDYRYILVKPTSDVSCGTSSSANIDTTVCKGSCPYFTARASGSAYKWSTGETTRTIQFCPKRDTFLSVTVYDGANETTCFYAIYVTKTTCVWPGDANNDGVADKNDVLAIGVAYGDSGTARTGASTNWTGQACSDWTNAFTSGANYKNADCNGDGGIDSTDMLAVAKNYGYIHTKTEAANGASTDPPLAISFSKDSAKGNDTVQATINLGTSANPVKNAYGLAFTVKYPSKYVKSGSSLADFSKCWLGTPGKNLIYMVHIDSGNGELNIGITRTDHKNINGYGQLGVLSVVMQDNVGGKTTIDRTVTLDITDVKMISANEAPISLYATGDSARVTFNHSTGIMTRLPDNAIQLYPNPVSEKKLTLDAGSQVIKEIRIVNMLGQQVYESKIADLDKLEIPAGHLLPGIYSISITTNAGVLVKQFEKH